MVNVSFRSKFLHYEGNDDFESKVTEYVKSLGASTDGTTFTLRKREHIVLIEQYVENLKKSS